MRNKLLKLEIMASIWWLLMDMFWMFDYVGYALFFSPLVIINMSVGYNWTTSKIEKKALLVTFLWFVMNTFWMITDLCEGTSIMVLKCIAAVFGLGAFGILVFWALEQTAKEK